MQEKQWFESWFDSPWYPILYQNRNEAEAETFISNLLEQLNPPAGSKFLDLACGRGRHSIFIHSKGFQVTGLDLSPASIADASQHAQKGLDFGVQDMRMPFPAKYDYIFNLFTSFGYFDDVADNHKVLANVQAALNPGGIFVMDFFNIHQVLANLVEAEKLERQGIEFDIQRRYDGQFVRKQIRITDNGQLYEFEERVQAFQQQQLQEMLQAHGLALFGTWGNYHGAPFDPANSNRLIIFAKKRID